MTSQPGLPVATEQDRHDWERWRKDRKRQQQRERRAIYPRIDYYPDKLAAAAIERLRSRYAGGDASSIINRIVAEWVEATKVPPE